MKILAICGSPREGNCYSALNTIQESHPAIDFELIMLGKQNLEMCRGCYACIQYGEENGPLEEDRDMIIQAMVDADGVIFASPVYVNQLSALMKKFIERTGFLGHRPRFRNKQAMVLSVCRAFGAKNANKAMKEAFSSYGFDIVSELELKATTESKKERELNRKKTLKAFDKLAVTIEKGEKAQPTITNLVMFDMFKYASEAFPDHFPADNEYYRDMTEYPYDGRINFFKKAIAKRALNKFKKELEAERV